MVRETRHLWVGNLPENIREERIREHFKRYGRVQSVKLLPRCTEEKTGGEVTMACTVAFMDIKSASKAHNSELKIDDRTLNTEYYEPAAIPSSASPQTNTPSPYSTSPGSTRFPNGHGSSEDHGASAFSDRCFYERSSSSRLASGTGCVGVNVTSVAGSGSGEVSSDFGGSGRANSSRVNPSVAVTSATPAAGSYHGDAGTTIGGRSSSSSSTSTAASVGGGSTSGRSKERTGSSYRNGPFASAPATTTTLESRHSSRAATVNNSWGYEATRYNNSTGNNNQTDTGYSSTPSEGNERRSSDQSLKKKTTSRSGSRSPSPSGSTSSRSPSRSRSRSSSSSSSSSMSRDTSSTSSPKSKRLTSSSTSNSNHQPVVHSDDRRPLAICVKNLPVRSSDTSLKDGLFHEYKKHGKVTWVKVVGKDAERHAIVCFKKPEDAEKALEVSYDKFFFGCKIEVAPYQGYDVEDNDLRPYEAEIDEYNPKATRTLFIGNLEKDVTASDLRKHFDQFGEIIEIDIKKQGAVSSYAFCQYSDIVSVVKAIRKMDGEHLGNNRIKLGFGKSMPYICVWIDGVNENVNEKYLKMQFEPFGVINKIYIDREKGQALIFYDQVMSAQTAVTKMRGFTLKNTKIQVDFASRECQESFFERLEKQGAILDRSIFEERREPAARVFDGTSSRFASRYDTPTRPRTASYSSRSNATAVPVTAALQSPGTPGSVTPRGTSSRSRARFADYYDQTLEYADRHFRSYDEYSQSSTASHEDLYDHEYGFVHDGGDPLQVIDNVVAFAPPDMRNLQKERVHLLEQLEECPSSGDELISPKKRMKLDLLDSVITSDVIIEANRDHRKVMEVRRLSDVTLKHHSRRPSIDSSKHVRHDVVYVPHSVCKRRKTAGSDSGSKVHHFDHSGSESVGGSRPGTPLCDEKPENFQPSEPRRVPREREGPLTLPLPRFAAQIMNRGSVSVAGIKGQKDNILSSPPPAVTSPRISNPRPPSPVHVPPPASPPPRPPSLSSNSSDSDTTPLSLSLEERIKSLDEKYEKWSGSRALSAAGGDALALLDANLEKFRQRHKILDLDLKEVQPSEIVKSVMAKRSVFDEDLKRLENVGEKYEPKDFSFFPRSSLTTQTSVPAPPLPAPVALKLTTVTSIPKTPTLLSPRSSGAGIQAAKGLQYPFPTHPPILMSPVVPTLVQTTPTTTTSVVQQPVAATTAVIVTATVTASTTTSSLTSQTATASRGASHGENRLKSCPSVPSETRTTSKLTVNKTSVVSSLLPVKISEKTNVNIPGEGKNNRDGKCDKSGEKISCRRDSSSNSPRADVKTRRNSDTSSRRSDDSDVEQVQKERAQSEERKRERIEKIKVENEKLEKEKSERERVERERYEHEKQEKIRLEKERIEKERLERESELEKQRLEKERLEKERLEKERIEKEKMRLEKERTDRENYERIQREKEKERLERQRIEKERKEKEESERKLREEQEKQRLETERLEKEAERTKREDKERREEHERLEKEKSDKEKERAKYKEDNQEKRKDDHRHRESPSDTKHKENHVDHRSTKETMKDEKLGSKDINQISTNTHDSRSSFDKKLLVDRDSERRKESIKENRDNNIHEKHKNISDHKHREVSETRHMSIDLDKAKTHDKDPSKRKERNNSLPANIGSKRRYSSQEIGESEDSKKIRLSHDSKKVSERRDSKDSIRSDDKMKNSKHKNNVNKSSHDKHNSTKESEEKRKEREERHKKHKLEKQKSKSKSREKEANDLVSLTDKEFLNKLELKSVEENEKHKKESKEKRTIFEEHDKIKKEKHAIEKTIHSIDKHCKVRIEGEVGVSKCNEEKKKRERIRKLTNTSDSDSDEPKKHSIFDIVDDEPAYISMYDKVKARSCKNMAKLEEEKRQEKLKAKFTQLKQSRAKREEKKRSTSWDEDSDSDKDNNEIKIKRCPKMLIDSSDDENTSPKLDKKKEMYSDSDSSAIFKHLKQEIMDTSDEELRRKNILKSIKALISSDTSEDERTKKKSHIKTELFSDSGTTDIIQSCNISPDDKSQLFKVKEELNKSIKKERRNSKHQETSELNNSLFSDVSQPEAKPEKFNNKHSFIDITTDEETHEQRKERSERRERKHKKKQKKQKHSVSSEELTKLDNVSESNQTETSEKHKHEKKKDHSKKEKRRDKNREGREKSKKSKKNKTENKSEIKRDGKMETIFGSLSEDSENGTKEIQQEQPNVKTFTEEIKQQPINNYNSESEKEIENKIKEKTEREREKEEHKRKKEKKRREKERRLQEAAAAAATLAAVEQETNENSMDYIDMGKQLEANMLRDESLEANETSNKLAETTTFESIDDPFTFSELTVTENKKDKEERREGKEKKKKRKKSKDEKSKHHNHHHHDKSKKSTDTKKESKESNLPPTVSPLRKEEIEEVVPPSQPQNPSLPNILDDQNPINDKKIDTDLPVSPLNSIVNSPTSKSSMVSQEKKREKLIPGFGSEIDEKIHESAVKSISEFENNVRKEELVKDEEETPPVPDEKPRVVISQEETEDAVAALLGESFGTGMPEEFYNEDTTLEEPTHSSVEDNNVQDDEEMRQAVQSLSAADLDVKPDTPQSENDLQIDTDTEEQEEVPLRFDTAPKTPEMPVVFPPLPKTPDLPPYFSNHIDEKPTAPIPSLSTNIGSPPSLTPIRSSQSTEVIKNLEKRELPTPLEPQQRTVISQSWSTNNKIEVPVSKSQSSVIKIDLQKVPSVISNASVQQNTTPVISKSYSNPAVLKISEPPFPPLKPLSKTDHSNVSPIGDISNKIHSVPSTKSTPPPPQLHNLPARSPIPMNKQPVTVGESGLPSPRLPPGLIHSRMPITPVMGPKPMQATTVILQQPKVAHSLEPPKLVSTSDPRSRMVYPTPNIQSPPFSNYGHNSPRMALSSNIRHIPPQGLLVPARQMHPHTFMGNSPLPQNYNIPTTSIQEKDIAHTLPLTAPPSLVHPSSSSAHPPLHPLAIPKDSICNKSSTLSSPKTSANPSSPVSFSPNSSSPLLINSSPKPLLTSSPKTASVSPKSMANIQLTTYVPTEVDCPSLVIQSTSKIVEVPRVPTPKSVEPPRIPTPKLTEIPRVPTPNLTELSRKVTEVPTPKVAEVSNLSTPKQIEIPRVPTPKLVEEIKPKLVEIPKVSTPTIPESFVISAPSPVIVSTTSDSLKPLLTDIKNNETEFKQTTQNEEIEQKPTKLAIETVMEELNMSLEKSSPELKEEKTPENKITTCIINENELKNEDESVIKEDPLAEKPQLDNDTMDVTDIKEVEKLDEERTETESILSDISKERPGSADLLAKDDPLDTKEDSDYWSAKEVNIDSVIKTLCSADELSDHSSDNGKSDLFDDRKSDKSREVDKSLISTQEEKPEESNYNEETKNNVSDFTEESAETESAEVLEEPKEAPILRSSSRRGGRGRGRGGKPQKTTVAIERGGIQTRRGKLKELSQPAPVVPKRGRAGKVRNERKPSKTESESTPADVYEFRDEPDETNKEQRPRLIITIKSPAVSSLSNVHTTAIVKEVTKDGAKEIGKEQIKETSPSTNKPIENKEFVSPSAANTRKSRRLQERDTSKNNVDETIEDVVKNTIQTRASSNQRRSGRQTITKPNPSLTETPRKSPRGRKGRRGSEATETSSSEETPTKEDIKTMITSLPSPKTPEKPKEREKHLMEEEKVAEQTLEPLKEKHIEVTKPSVLRRIKGDITTPNPKEPTSLIDPVTGELIPMRESEEGKYIPLPGTNPTNLPVIQTKHEPTSLKETPIQQLKPVLEIVKTQPSVITQPQQVTVVQQQKPKSLKAHVLQAAQSIQTTVVQTKIPTEVPSSIVVTSKVTPQEYVVTKPLISAPPIVTTKAVTPIITKSITPIVTSKTVTPIVVTKAATPINQHLTINTNLNIGLPTTAHLSPRTNAPINVSTKPLPKQMVKPPVISPVLMQQKQQQIQHILQAGKQSQVSKAHLTPPMVSQAQMVNTQIAHIKHQPAIKQQVIMGKGPLVNKSLHQQQILSGAISSPPLGKSQPPLNNPGRNMQVPTPAKGMMDPPKVEVSMSNVILGQRPKLSPQGPQRIIGQTGLPLPGYEPSLGEAIAHFPPPGALRPPDINPAHYMHPSHVMQYHQQYFRQQQIQHQQQLRSGGMEKVGDGQEGEEAPVTSPPLELRRPGSVGLVLTGRSTAVPHSLNSPHDRTTDSPQVGQVYNVHSSARNNPYHHPNRYYDQTEPPPAHRPLTSHGSLAALGSDRGLAHMAPIGTPDRPLSGHSALSAHMGSLADRGMTTHIERPLSAHSLMGAGLGAAGNLMGAVARHIGAEAPASQRGLQAATPPHASQVPPQAESLLMLLKHYPCMWQGLLALKNDQAAVQMYLVSGNDDVAKCSLPKNTDGSTPPLRIFQRMRLEPPQVEGVARKMQMENEHCMLLALPCGHDHMDVLKQSTNLTSGFITYLQQKQAAGIVNVAAPGTTQPPAYVVHIFPSCDFVNENLRRIAPSLLERVADIAHLLIVITTV